MKRRNGEDRTLVRREEKIIRKGAERTEVIIKGKRGNEARGREDKSEERKEEKYMTKGEATEVRGEGKRKG